MSFAGIDADQFPGLAVMQRLKDETNAVFCGYYLVAPSHPNAGWTGQRAALAAMGWGFAPVYVGQETVGPGAHHVSAAQGAIDGADAAAKMAAEGFAPGSCVFLDLENGPPYASPMTDYVRAWCAAVAAAGFTQGVYCSHAIAQDVAAAQPDARIWAFRVATLARTEASAPFPTPDLAGCGYAAAVWQRADNVWLPDFRMLVDLDVASSADPSTPAT